MHCYPEMLMLIAIREIVDIPWISLYIYLLHLSRQT